MKKFYWSAISTDDRIKSISETSSIVDKFGIILNFFRSSDLSMGISIEIEEGKVNDLYINLKRILLIEGFDNNAEDSTKDCNILLNITFTKGTGDLEIEVPSIIE